MNRFKCILQNDETDCGPACLAAIFKSYNLIVSIAQIRDIAGTDKQGTSASGLSKAIEKYGFNFKIIQIDLDKLDAKLPLPAIAHVVVDKSLLHYVVITKIKNNIVYVSDPAKGIIKYSIDDFSNIWTNVIILIAPGKNAVSGNKKENTMISFLKIILTQKIVLAKVLLLSLIVTSLGIATAFYYQILMDNVLPSMSIAYLNYVSIFTLVLFLLQILISFLRGVLIVKMEQKLDLTILLGFYNHSLWLPMKFFSLRDTGDIISRFNDAAVIRETLSQVTITIMMDTILAIVGAIILLNSNVVLFLITLVMLVCYAIIVFAYNKPIRKNNRKSMELNSKVTSKLIESVNGIETIKIFKLELIKIKSTNKLYNKFLNVLFKGEMLFLTQQTATMFVSVVGSLAILWIGAMYVINGAMTLGELITFNALLAYFVDPVKNLLDLQPSIQTVVVAVDRLGEVLDISKEQNISSEEEDLEIDFNKIKISNLDFRYGTRELVLNKVNIEILKGQKVAFVGESGSGKSTLAKMLVRLYTPISGNILFDNLNIDSIEINKLRNNVCYISQSSFLFSGTIKENILYGNINANEEEIINVCKLCKLDDYINTLPLGYDTLIEENGKNLSAGQKQRLSIARALLSRPNVLIMDEATSNLDYITEREIEDTIELLCKKITVIIIAHRISLVKNCDNIFVFKNGEVIENGNHKNLVSKRGYYYQLCNSQYNKQ